jgi:hypothetical protein
VIEGYQRDPSDNPSQRQASKPILEKWPAGYECGFFRLDGSDIVIGAAGKPDLRIENAI